MEMDKYEKEEIVWAKIRGFPWWPGIVSKVYEQRDPSDPQNSNIEVLVNFIGENSHAKLPSSKVAKFVQNYDEFAKNAKKKRLLESIEVAMRILKGESTYDKEKIRLELNAKKQIQQTNNRGGKKSEMSDGEDDQRKKVTRVKDSKQPDSDSKLSRKLESKLDKPIEKIIKIENKTIKEIKDDNHKFFQEKKEKKAELKQDKRINRLKRIQKFDTEDMYIEESLISQIQNKERITRSTIKESVEIIELQSKIKQQKQLSPKKQNKVSQVLSDDSVFNNKQTKIIQEDQSKEEDVQLNKEFNEFESTISGEMLMVCQLLKSIDYWKAKDFSSMSKSMKRIIQRYEDILESEQNLYLIKCFDRQMGKYLVQFNQDIQALQGNDNLRRIREVKVLQSIDQELKNKIINFFYDSAENILEIDQKKEEDEENSKYKPQKKLGSNKKVKKEQKSENIVSDLKEEPKIQPNQQINQIKIDANQTIYNNNDRSNNNIDNFNNTQKDNNNNNYKNQSNNDNIDNNRNNDVMNKNNNQSSSNQVVDQLLRKKICQKLSKILQERQNLDKIESQRVTLALESRIRSFHPDMRSEYKDKIILILNLVKDQLVPIEQIMNTSQQDFYDLKKMISKDSKSQEL